MKRLTIAIALGLMISLSACSQNDGNMEKDTTNEPTTQNENKNENDTVPQNQNDDMEEHSSSKEVPTELEESQNPKYKIGSEITIEADHMEGMQGAEGKVVGAYDTRAYTVSYTPTDGGAREENHKWIIYEEIIDAEAKDDIKVGDTVILDSNHKKGMQGAEAEIVDFEDTTVYMIDYNPTTGEKEVKNHKWLAENEISESK